MLLIIFCPFYLSITENIVDVSVQFCFEGEKKLLVEHYCKDSQILAGNAERLKDYK
jgi:hypothetical protein